MNELIKFGNTALPNEYITADGYKVTANQRTELEAYRDADVNLHRVTSSNYKTTITLTLCPMSRSTLTQIQNIIADGTVDEVERKVFVTYFNDEDNCMKTGYFYITDVTYETLGDFGGERWLRSLTYTLIEY